MAKFDAVLAEIPRVREDLGFIPLVTPTSQIVGTQAVLNVLSGERYKSISKETAGVLKGEYGAAPAPFNKDLQARVLEGKEAITCRPADLLEDEMAKLTDELKKLASEKNIKLAANVEDDVLTYALFPQVGLKFLENRGNASAFEPVPSASDVAPAAAKAAGPEVYTVNVNGQDYVVKVSEGGDITHAAPVGAVAGAASPAPAVGSGEPVASPLGGTIMRILVQPGDAVEEGEVLLTMEAMKMETEVRAFKSGQVTSVDVKSGDAVTVGQTLLSLA